MKKNFAKSFLLTTLAGAALLAGCNYLEAETESLGFIEAPAENSILLCSDGLDNDKDGLIDCEDPDCVNAKGTELAPGPGSTVCSPNEDNNYVCADGLDNDGDGFVDCNDNSCKPMSVCCISTGAENTIEACSDGIDNDCNGYMDCKDYSCSRSTNPEVVAYCKSVNCPLGQSTEGTTVESCTDGIDNDCNGYIDCNDHACSKSTNPEVKQACVGVKPTQENSIETCTDGIDNDLNGLIDCADNDCAQLECCTNITPEPKPRDPKFSSMTDEQKIEILRAEYTACTDGIDNDKDSLVDCEEYQCHLLSQQKLTGIFEEFQIICD